MIWFYLGSLIFQALCIVAAICFLIGTALFTRALAAYRRGDKEHGDRLMRLGERFAPTTWIDRLVHALYRR